MARSPDRPARLRDASAATGLGMAVVVAANRTRHPLDARTLARLAARYAGSGVVSFGLSNDERRGSTSDFAPAFTIAERAGLVLAPHGGELLGPESVRSVWTSCTPTGSGTASGSRRTPGCSTGSSSRACRSRCARCPTSRSASTPTSTPCRCPAARRRRAVALGADDPLLFGGRLAAQYAAMRAAHAAPRRAAGQLARMSVRASRAPRSSGTRCSPASTAGWGPRPVRSGQRACGRAGRTRRDSSSRRSEPLGHDACPMTAQLRPEPQDRYRRLAPPPRRAEPPTASPRTASPSTASPSTASPSTADSTDQQYGQPPYGQPGPRATRPAPTRRRPPEGDHAAGPRHPRHRGLRGRRAVRLADRQAHASRRSTLERSARRAGVRAGRLRPGHHRHDPARPRRAGRGPRSIVACVVVAAATSASHRRELLGARAGPAARSRPAPAR